MGDAVKRGPGERETRRLERSVNLRIPVSPLLPFAVSPFTASRVKRVLPEKTPASSRGIRVPKPQQSLRFDDSENRYHKSEISIPLLRRAHPERHKPIASPAPELTLPRTSRTVRSSNTPWHLLDDSCRFSALLRAGQRSQHGPLDHNPCVFDFRRLPAAFRR